MSKLINACTAIVEESERRERDFMRKLGIFINKGGGIEPLPLWRGAAIRDLKQEGLHV